MADYMEKAKTGRGDKSVKELKTGRVLSDKLPNDEL